MQELIGFFRFEAHSANARPLPRVGELQGRTENNRIVNFPAGPHAARLVGQLIDVTITEARPHSLRGAVAVKQSEVAA